MSFTPAPLLRSPRGSQGTFPCAVPYIGPPSPPRGLPSPGGRCQPPSPARRMTDEGTQRTDLLFFAGMVPTRRPPRRRGVPFPAMGKEPKDRPGNLPKGSNRSGCFDWKRRSDRMYARDCGDYANRDPAAHEVRDDESPPPGQGGPFAPHWIPPHMSPGPVVPRRTPVPRLSSKLPAKRMLRREEEE